MRYQALAVFGLSLYASLSWSDHHVLAKRAADLAENLEQLAIVETNAFCRSQIIRASQEASYASGLYLHKEYYAGREMMKSASMDLAYTQIKTCSEKLAIINYQNEADDIVHSTRPDVKIH